MILSNAQDVDNYVYDISVLKKLNISIVFKTFLNNLSLIKSYFRFL